MQTSRVTSGCNLMQRNNRMETHNMQSTTDTDPNPRPGGEKIPPGGWRATQDEYRTRDGRGFFEFRFVAFSSYFEVDIVSMPSYNSRNEGAHETHRLTSDRGGKRICFGDASAISTLQIAYEFAESWAENTWRYIQTGVRF